MRPSTVRLCVAAAGLAALGLVSAASAGTPVPGPRTLVITDASGDSLGAAGDDIAKVTYSTTGTKAKVGTKIVYTPKALTMTIQTTEPISTDGSVQYNLEGNLRGCGDFVLYVAPGATLEGLAGTCFDDESVTFANTTYAVSGSKITFRIPLKSVPGAVAGGVLTGLFAYTGTVDPVTGEVGTVVIGPNPLDNDEISSDKNYKIG